jgi:CubicO group peptidase (beta-lactamase class C family)
MIISSYDLAKFMLMHMNDGQYKKGKRIISSESEKEMRIAPKDNKNYGLALAHYNFLNGVDLIGMTGGARGMHTAMYFNPDEKYGFVVFCNGCNSSSAADGGLNIHVVKELFSTFISR